MSWVKVFDQYVLPDRWYFTEVLPTGTYFRIENTIPSLEVRGKVAQCEIDVSNSLIIYNQELLRIRDAKEVYKLQKPPFLSQRRVAINIQNTELIPLELWQCRIQIYGFLGEQIIEGTRSVIITELDLLPSQDTFILSSSELRRGHVIENVGQFPCVVSYSPSVEFSLYEVVLLPGSKYGWDYPEVFPFLGFSAQGSRLKVFDIY